MTELLTAPVEVRVDAAGEVVALRLRPAPWRRVERVVNRWMVEGDWWREPVHRDYHRCLLEGGDCVELCRDAESGAWTMVRRYD